MRFTFWLIEDTLAVYTGMYAAKGDAMQKLHVKHAFLGDRWASNVEFSWENQTLNQVRENAERQVNVESVEVAIPGMPNLHSHAFQRAMAGLTEYQQSQQDSFWSWRETMYGFASKMSLDDFYATACQVYLDMLEAGYTHVVEFHYLHRLGSCGATSNPLETARLLLKAAGETGIGITLCPVLYLSSGFGAKPLQEKQKRFHLDVSEYCQYLQTLSGYLTNDQLLGIAFHSLRAVPPEAMREVLAFWREFRPNGPIHIHISEQMAEVEACVAWSGKRPVRWLLDTFEVDHRWCLVHATHLEQDEIKDLAKSGAVAGLCPTTEANLGDGFFPMMAYLQSGGVWGIGSDSHCSVSPVEDLRWLEYGQRLLHQKRNRIVSDASQHIGRSLWQQALKGGWQAIGCSQAALQVGSRVDLLVLDRLHPLLAAKTEDGLLDALIFAGNQNLFSRVLAGGRWLVAQGNHVHKTQINARFCKSLQSLLNSN